MLVIRLSPKGCKNNPFYRINVADSKKAVSGKFIEILGFYRPRGKKEFSINKEAYEAWLKKGAKPTKRIRSLVKKRGGE